MKILLAIDGSPCSDAAVAEIARWPWSPQSEVRIVTVDVPVDPGVTRGSPSTAFDALVSAQRAEAQNHLRKAVATLAERAPGLRATPVLLEGLPKDAIVNEAERWGADLVVVGSHGYGPIRRFFLGSVSLFVTHHAPCSVLVVRQPAEIIPTENPTK